MTDTVSRNPVQSLRPLTDAQQVYMDRLGRLSAVTRYKSDTVWWHNYFGFVAPGSPTINQILMVASASKDPIPFSTWDDPGADISNKLAYTEAVLNLEALLMHARRNRTTAQKLVKDGLYPPVFNRNDPFAIPTWFGWWQAENAFRRGFVGHYEEEFLRTFKEMLKDLVSRDGNMLTASGMKELGEAYARDPFIEAYFLQVSSDIAEQVAAPFSSLKAFYQDMLKKRARAYRQFSPYFQPLRWAPGGGLVGVEEK